MTTRRDAGRVKEEKEEKEEDSDDEVEDEEVLKVGKVSAGTKNKQANRVKKEAKEPRGVVYLGHLPQGFFEPQLRTFLAQFGKVTRLRLSRSKKNAHSKGYAYVEFEHVDVAQIVAETMDKYMLFGRNLEAHIVPAEKRHPALFRHAGKKMKPLDRKRMATQKLQHNKVARPGSLEKPPLPGGDKKKKNEPPPASTRQVARRIGKHKRKRQALKAHGIEYDFEGWTKTIGSASSSKSNTASPGKDKKKKKGLAKSPVAASEEVAATAKELKPKTQVVLAKRKLAPPSPSPKSKESVSKTPETGGKAKKRRLSKG